MHEVFTLANDIATVGAIVGLLVLIYGVLDGIFMIWDKLFPGAF